MADAQVDIELVADLALDYEEHFLLSLQPPLLRAPGREAEDALFQPLAAVGGVEDDADAGRVALFLHRLDVRLAHDEAGDRGHPRDCCRASRFGRAASVR